MLDIKVWYLGQILYSWKRGGMPCHQQNRVCRFLHNFMAHHPWQLPKVTNMFMRGTRFSFESILVIWGQILGINYNFEKFQFYSNLSQWKLAGSKIKLVVPLKDLSFSAVFQILHFVSEHVQHKHHREQTNVRWVEWLRWWYSRVTLWWRNEFVLSVFSELINSGCDGVCGLDTCSLGAGPAPPTSFIATSAFWLLGSKGTIISLMIAFSSGVDAVINGIDAQWLWYT